MTKSGSIYLRIGILLTVLGFGSLVLMQFNMDFRLISWADDMQPTFGIVLGLIGVAVLALPFLLRRKAAEAPQQQFAQQPPQYPAQPIPGQPLPGQPPVPGAPQQYPPQPGQPS